MWKKFQRSKVIQTDPTSVIISKNPPSTFLSERFPFCVFAYGPKFVKTFLENAFGTPFAKINPNQENWTLNLSLRYYLKYYLYK